jgi:hypothetical protein
VRIIAHGPPRLLARALLAVRRGLWRRIR